MLPFLIFLKLFIALLLRIIFFLNNKASKPLSKNMRVYQKVNYIGGGWRRIK